MNKIYWSGYSNQERHTAISTIKIVVSKYGDIVDFKFFSDISLTMEIEITESKIDKLYDELKFTMTIDKFEYLNSVSSKERTLFFNISFVKGTGNLMIELPSVPG